MSGVVATTVKAIKQFQASRATRHQCSGAGCPVCSFDGCESELFAAVVGALSEVTGGDGGPAPVIGQVTTHEFDSLEEAKAYSEGFKYGAKAGGRGLEELYGIIARNEEKPPSHE